MERFKIIWWAVEGVIVMASVCFFLFRSMAWRLALDVGSIAVETDTLSVPSLLRYPISGLFCVVLHVRGDGYRPCMTRPEETLCFGWGASLWHLAMIPPFRVTAAEHIEERRATIEDGRCCWLLACISYHILSSLAVFALLFLLLLLLLLQFFRPVFNSFLFQTGKAKRATGLFSGSAGA